MPVRKKLSSAQLQDLTSGGISAGLPKKKAIKASDLYTAREVTVDYGTGPVTGYVSNGGQCSDREFAFSGPERTLGYGRDERCVRRSDITKLGK